MEDLTILEWLEEQPLSGHEIDFLITFIPYISMIKVLPEKLEVMCQSLNRQFPKVDLHAEEGDASTNEGSSPNCHLKINI
ncbi:hypothetical protein NQ117_11330 [Paenibacillus sp. SC116]|uniref:hypothetical protein n=1 Tax=Paenibacillus sp. SC116 TaxID=2968986 RepID=UPI00215AA076|nr:hypothetical protein [Paenibacillus sp. SC116]MCR8844279.1 hypothetical protein [Paenibacillus sp. SC116]